MRPTSTLSLLLFLQLSTAAPLPITKILPSNCQHFLSCSSLRDAASLPPISKPSNPHFPSHQLSPPTFNRPTTTSQHYNSQELIINNAPTTPSRDTTPEEALSAQSPLTTEYLQSLSPDTQDALPSMPTSALPALRKADAEKYWEEQEDRKMGSMNEMKCGGAMGASTLAFEVKGRLENMARERRNSTDFMVVGIVLLFLVVVCVFEAVDKLDRRRNSSPHRRGEIYLEDDESLTLIIKSPKSLQCSRLSSLKEDEEEQVVIADYKDYTDDETCCDEDECLECEREKI